jgi:hypothetical protein
MSDKRSSADLRQQVFERADGCCGYCRSQARYASQTFSAEHIIPRARGGVTELPTSRWPARAAQSQVPEDRGRRSGDEQARAALPPAPGPLGRAFRLERRLRPADWADANRARDDCGALAQPRGRRQPATAALHRWRAPAAPARQCSCMTSSRPRTVGSPVVYLVGLPHPARSSSGVPRTGVLRHRQVGIDVQPVPTRTASMTSWKSQPSRNVR